MITSTTASFRPRTPRTRRILGALRLVGYCVTTGLVFGSAALGSAYAGVKDAALALGSELGHLDGVGSERPILLNGQPIFVAAATESLEPEALLDRAAARCDADAAPGRVIRHDDGDRGMVACLAGPGEPGGDVAAVARIVETGEIGALRSLRYVSAERVAPGRTRVVTAWTDGSFNLRALLAPDGDAPGGDAPGIPRPGGSVRLLTATVAGAPYSLRIYLAPGSAAEILARYDAEMPARGWERVLGGGDDQAGRVYGRAGVKVHLSARADERGTLVTLVGLGGS